MSARHAWDEPGDDGPSWGRADRLARDPGHVEDDPRRWRARMTFEPEGPPVTNRGHGQPFVPERPQGFERPQNRPPRRFTAPSGQDGPTRPETPPAPPRRARETVSPTFGGDELFSGTGTPALGFPETGPTGTTEQPAVAPPAQPSSSDWVSGGGSPGDVPAPAAAVSSPGEPVAIAQGITTALGAAVTAGWVALPNTTIDLVGTAVALVAVAVTTVVARSRVKPWPPRTGDDLESYIRDVAAAELAAWGPISNRAR